MHKIKYILCAVLIYIYLLIYYKKRRYSQKTLVINYKIIRFLGRFNAKAVTQNRMYSSDEHNQFIYGFMLNVCDRNTLTKKFFIYIMNIWICKFCKLFES